MLWNIGDQSRWVRPCHWDTTAGMSQLTFILQGTLGGDRTFPIPLVKKSLGKGLKSTCPFLHPPQHREDAMLEDWGGWVPSAVWLLRVSPSSPGQQSPCATPVLP